MTVASAQATRPVEGKKRGRPFAINSDRSILKLEEALHVGPKHPDVDSAAALKLVLKRAGLVDEWRTSSEGTRIAPILAAMLAGRLKPGAIAGSAIGTAAGLDREVVETDLYSLVRDLPDARTRKDLPVYAARFTETLRRNDVVLARLGGASWADAADRAGIAVGELPEVVGSLSGYEKVALRAVNGFRDYPPRPAVPAAQQVINLAALAALWPAATTAELAYRVGRSLRTAEGPGGPVVRSVGVVAEYLGEAGLVALSPAERLSRVVADAAGATQDWLIRAVRRPALEPPDEF